MITGTRALRASIVSRFPAKPPARSRPAPEEPAALESYRNISGGVLWRAPDRNPDQDQPRIRGV